MVRRKPLCQGSVGHIDLQGKLHRNGSQNVQTGEGQIRTASEFWTLPGATTMQNCGDSLRRAVHLVRIAVPSTFRHCGHAIKCKFCKKCALGIEFR